MNSTLTTRRHDRANLHSVTSPANWPATDALIKELAPTWLRTAGIESFARELEALGDLDTKAVHLTAVSILGRATLTADVAALGTVSGAIEGRDSESRALIVSMLGHTSCSAWQRVEVSVRQTLMKASEEQHLAPSLVVATQDALTHRQTNSSFASWVSHDPDGLAGHAWATALRTAGERLWERNWAKVSALGSLPTRLGSGSTAPLKYQPGMLRLRQATKIAHQAAVDSLLRAAVQNEPQLRVSAWDDALVAAHNAPGAAAWSADVDATRAGVGEAAWAAANQSARATVQVVVNELPFVVGRIAMVALAAEACSAAARSVAIRAGAAALSGHADAALAGPAASESMASAIDALCA